MTGENDSAEQRLAASGVPIEEEDFGDEISLDITGCIAADFVQGEVRFIAVARAGLPQWQRAMFLEWAESRFERIREHGPEPDGWQNISDDTWQLCAEIRQMPDDPEYE
jgi:hypothetical protein